LRFEGVYFKNFTEYKEAHKNNYPWGEDREEDNSDDDKKPPATNDDKNTNDK
jgi:hypothetical protein